jgi:hypothetical protein
MNKKPNREKHMKQQQTIGRRMASLSLMLGLIVLGSGCAAVHSSKTVGLSGLPPLASAKQVKVVQHREDVTQPYQVVGQITVRRSGTMLTTGTSLDRMKQIAAAMGADGLIGLIESHGDGKILGIGSGYAWVHSCLAVKWLAPGQLTQPLAVPLVVGLLPSSAASDQAKFGEIVYESVRATLGLKGYYPLPLNAPILKSGFGELSNLGEPELQTLGGPQTQLLLDVSLMQGRNTYYVVGNNAKAEVQLSIFDKQSRKIILQEGCNDSSMDLFFVPGGPGVALGPFFIDQQRREVFLKAVNHALQNLPPIAVPANAN